MYRHSAFIEKKNKAKGIFGSLASDRKVTLKEEDRYVFINEVVKIYEYAPKKFQQIKLL